MLWVHRGERADVLADALVDVVAEPAGAPFVPELVAVPTRGVERWLTHRLATRLGATSPADTDGVCANVEFPFPHRLVAELLAARVPGASADHWQVAHVVWAVLEEIDLAGDEPWLELLATHLDAADDLRSSRRYATARHLAELFDRYGTHRPAMVRAWLDGDDHDGAGTPLPRDARWQAELFRRVRQRIGTPSPPELVETGCRLLAERPPTRDEPARLSVFGLTRLPASQLEVLVAAAVHRDVHLFTLHPSLALVEDLPATAPTGPIPRRDDHTADAARHPLLRSWGTDAREMQLVLGAVGGSSVAHPAPGDATTLLARLQAEVRSNGGPGDGGRARLDPSDDSIRVHACHGAARQVEVARDAIGRLLADDPTLEPRDVIVLCPDIDAYAPLLTATFGAAVDDPATTGSAPDTDARGVPRIPFRLADRSPRTTNPLLAALVEVLHLIEGRLRVADLVAFAGTEPVRRRFRFDDDDLEQVTAWAVRSGVRWGLDGDHRADFWLAGVEDNTWRSGLDRLLLGIALDEEKPRRFEECVPFDDIDGSGADLLGRFAELVDRLRTVRADTARPLAVGAWLDLLGRIADLLFDTTWDGAWQRSELDGLLRDLHTEAAAVSPDTGLTRSEVRDLLTDRLQPVPTRADFRTGAVTMCTLVPMRSVPHRVVCILGLDDGEFPRSRPPDGDDLLARAPMVGDRDPRSEDRQLLLDAVLAATEHLVLTYSAHDERTNAPRPPAVPLAELLDVLDRTADHPDGDRGCSAAIVVHHPLHPFDARSFSPDVAGGAVDPLQTPWSFDRDLLAGARGRDDVSCPPRAFLRAPLDAVDDGPIDLGDLVRFVQHPMREFLRQRLGLQTWEDDPVLPEHVPVELDGLETWQVGQRLLDQLLANASPDAIRAGERARGTLPPGSAGDAVLTSVLRTATALRDRAVGEDVAGDHTSVEVATADLTGTVGGVRGDSITTVTYSNIAPRHRLAAWVQLLAITAVHPQRPWRSVVVGKRDGSPAVVELPALGSDELARTELASRHLAAVVGLHRAGMRTPLPLPCKTAAAWASARRRGKDPVPAATREWTTAFNYTGEDRDRSHRIVLGGTAGIERLLSAVPEPDESGPGWDGTEHTRLGRLAERLWAPILGHERWR